MKIITLNVNGIRSAHRKGFYSWLSRQDADVICLQEIKCQVDQLSEDILAPAGYHAYFNCAEKKGYSGVALYSRAKPDKVHDALGWDHADTEGRYLRADFGRFGLTQGVSAQRGQRLKAPGTVVRVVETYGGSVIVEPAFAQSGESADQSAASSAEA